MLDSRLVMIRCPIGGIGRRARLKIEFRKKCWFDSGMGHHFKHDLLKSDTCKTTSACDHANPFISLGSISTIPHGQGIGLRLSNDRNANAVTKHVHFRWSIASIDHARTFGKLRSLRSSITKNFDFVRLPSAPDHLQP